MNLETGSGIIGNYLQKLSAVSSTCVAGSVVDPDLRGSGSSRATMTHKNWKKFIHRNFWSKKDKYFLSVIFSNFRSSKPRIRIQIHLKCWIRLWIRIHNTDWLLGCKTRLILSVCYIAGLSDGQPSEWGEKRIRWEGWVQPVPTRGRGLESIRRRRRGLDSTGGRWDLGYSAEQEAQAEVPEAISEYHIL